MYIHCQMWKEKEQWNSDLERLSVIIEYRLAHPRRGRPKSELALGVGWKNLSEEISAHM